MRRDKDLEAMEGRLERSAWGKGGVYLRRLAVPAARPSQIRAGAKKLRDRLRADQRKFQKARLAHAA